VVGLRRRNNTAHRVVNSMVEEKTLFHITMDLDIYIKAVDDEEAKEKVYRYLDENDMKMADMLDIEEIYFEE